MLVDLPGLIGERSFSISTRRSLTQERCLLSSAALFRKGNHSGAHMIIGCPKEIKTRE